MAKVQCHVFLAHPVEWVKVEGKWHNRLKK